MVKIKTRAILIAATAYREPAVTNSTLTPDPRCRQTVSPEAISAGFSDHTPPLDPHEAAVAADRCYFCHDAPCVGGSVPTGIDIPLFIRQIATGTPEAAAETILSGEYPWRHVRPCLPDRDTLRRRLRARNG